MNFGCPRPLLADGLERMRAALAGPGLDALGVRA
jgi:hypothetical protein